MKGDIHTAPDPGEQLPPCKARHGYITNNLSLVDCEACQHIEFGLPDVEMSGPPPGSWADVAREMSKMFPDEDWDAWKDQMKEGDQ